ncbi:MAG: 50S ribosomal protein L15 [Patescibacteria group bacterium]
MILSLHTLTAKKKKKHIKRVGRGNASGHGTYSGRGLKGQKARSGGKKGREMKGLRAGMKQIPKLGGFKSLKPTFKAINLSLLENNFSEGDIVNLRSLRERKLIKNRDNFVKILGEGKLTKKLIVEIKNFSQTAKKAIEDCGGEIKLDE